MVACSKRRWVGVDLRVVEVGYLLRVIQRKAKEDQLGSTLDLISQLYQELREKCKTNRHLSHHWISRNQFMEVMTSGCMESELITPTSINSLFSSFDPDFSGKVKFIKLIVSLVFGYQPDFSNLTSMLIKGEKEEEIEEEGEEATAPSPPISQLGTLPLLRLVWGFYHDLDGNGMLLGDVEEALLSVSMSEDGYRSLQDIIRKWGEEEEWSQFKTQSRSLTISGSSCILQEDVGMEEEDFVEFITDIEEVWGVWGNQVMTYRSLILPYTLQDRVTFGDVLEQKKKGEGNGIFGTREVY